jgi:hypothetical protein
MYAVLPRSLLARPTLGGVALAILAAASACPALADDAGTSAAPRYNGFGTLAGFVVDPSDGWGFRREVTQPGHHDDGPHVEPDTRLGLQAQWSASPQVELVGQLVFKSRADSAPLSDNVAWAFAAWHPTTDWTLRVGRTSPDIFLLADVRNVGFAYPWIRPNVEFYGWIPLSSSDGLDVTHEWTTGDVRWRAKLFTGNSDITIASNQAGEGDTHARVKWFNGGTLTLDRGGFTLKATLAEARTAAPGSANRALGRQVLGAVAAVPLPVLPEQATTLLDSYPSGLYITRYAALSAAWENGPWQLQAEAANLSGNFDATKGWFAYGSAAYRAGNLTWFGMAGDARDTAAPLPEAQWVGVLAPLAGPERAAAAQAVADGVAGAFNLGRIDQHSFSAGLRWDVGPQTALKLQLDDIHTAPFGGGLWAFNTTDAHHALVLSTGVDFVF